MSHEPTEGTKLGPGFAVTGISGAGATIYPNEVEMEDTASSSLRVVGEIVPESTVSSLGLTPADVHAAGSGRSVMGLRTAETRIQGEADVGTASDAFSGESLSNPGVSGTQMLIDAAPQTAVTATSLRHSRPKSPLERALSPKRSQASVLRARFARLGQAKLLQYMQTPDDVPEASVPRDTVTRGEADAALAQLQEQISAAHQRTEELVTRVEDTRRTAEAAGHIASQGTSGVARTNEGLDCMVEELRNELQVMRTRIADAENRASDARRVADSAEKRASKAQYAADAAEKRAVTVQREADAAKQTQQRLETELQNADTAFRNEKTQRERLEAAAHADIKALRQELQSTKVMVEKQDDVMKDVAGIGIDMQAAKQEIMEQRQEMKEIGEVTDGVMGHVETLTATFKKIDQAQQKAAKQWAKLVPDYNVKGTSEHVQGTTSDLKEPVGHVQSVPKSVIDLTGEGRKEKEVESIQEMIRKAVEDSLEKVRSEFESREHQSVDETPETGDAEEEYGIPYLTGRPWTIKGQNNASTSQNEPLSSFEPMTSFGPLMSTANEQESSREAQQTGEQYRPPTIPSAEASKHRVVVQDPPKLPSGTQKAIEGIMAAYLQKLGIQHEPQKDEDASQNVAGNTVGNASNRQPEPTQFTFQNMQDNVAPKAGQQVFATAQWRPKEPPMYTGAATDDVYLWTSLVKQYFVFMKGDAEQEVAFAATLLRGAAHEWYMGYEKRNGNRPARDWPTLMQAILERFGSNVREQEAHAKLLTISQGKRSVREYTSEFETLLGRLSTRDEATWQRMFVWGLQPHLGKAVALKYPTSIAQAAGHAEEIELAIKASQRPNLHQPGARATVSYNARGGSSVVPRSFAQGRGRGNAGPMQRGGRGQGGRHRGSWNRGRQSGQQHVTQAKTGTQCFNCGQYGHYASQCPRAASTSGSNTTAQSVNQRSNNAQVRGQRGGRFRGNRRGGRGARFSGMNVIYDTEGNEYPVDENGNIVLEIAEEYDADTSHQNEETSGN